MPVIIMLRRDVTPLRLEGMVPLRYLVLRQITLCSVWGSGSGNVPTMRALSMYSIRSGRVVRL